MFTLSRYLFFNALKTWSFPCAQIIESPIFIQLRIQLLEPVNDRLPPLLKSLYGLLMILPQTSAYKSLRDRLDRISKLHTTLERFGVKAAGDSKKRSNAIANFDRIQRRHSLIIPPPATARKNNSSYLARFLQTVYIPHRIPNVAAVVHVDWTHHLVSN